MIDVFVAIFQYFLYNDIIYWYAYYCAHTGRKTIWMLYCLYWKVLVDI